MPIDDTIAAITEPKTVLIRLRRLIIALIHVNRARGVDMVARRKIKWRPIGTRPYWFRFLVLVSIYTAINLTGVVVTQQIGWSILFFDMIGTAAASLVGGAAAGMLVALLTGMMGWAIVGHSEYYVFSLVNIVGALLWAILPRTGNPFFCCNIFNTTSGGTYRRSLLNTIWLGSLVGIGTSIVAFIIQAYVLGATRHGYAAQDILGGGTDTALNNATMIATVVQMVGGTGRHTGEIVMALASFLTNIPDKIIATSAAIMLVMFYRTLPNFVNQKKAIRREIVVNSANIIDHRRLLMFLCLIPICSMPIVVYNIGQNLTGAALMMGACLVITVLMIIDITYLRSVDRIPAVDNVGENLFYAPVSEILMAKHKAAFEDVMKLMTVVVSGISFIVAGMSGSQQCMRSDHLESVMSCGPLYYLAAVNILIVTGFRYLCVIAIRWSDRM